MLKVSYQAVIDLIKTGALPAIRITPKLIRIRESALNQYLSTSEITPMKKEE